MEADDYIPSASDLAEYDVKVALTRIDDAFRFMRQYHHPWQFRVLFMSKTLQDRLFEAVQYFPLSSPWSVRVYSLRKFRCRNALVIFQGRSTSSFWNNIPCFMACTMCISDFEGDKYLSGNGSRGKDILNVNLYSPTSKQAQRGYRWSSHFCDVGMIHELIGGAGSPGLVKYRNTFPCETFQDYSPQQDTSEQIPFNTIGFCKICGMRFFASSEYEPTAIEQAYITLFGTPEPTGGI
jgi:hypothetical protein